MMQDARIGLERTRAGTTRTTALLAGLAAALAAGTSLAQSDRPVEREAAASSTSASEPAASRAPAQEFEPSSRVRQDIQGGAPGQAPQRWGALLDVSSTFRLRGDLDDNRGEVGIYRIGAGVSVSGPVLERGRLSITGGTEQSYYDFARDTSLITGGGRPWRHIQSYTLGANLSYQFSETVSGFVLGSIEFAGEDSAAWNDGFMGGGGGGLFFKVTDDLDLGAGVIVRSRLGGGTRVFPIVGIDWRFAPNWRLSNENQPGLYLSYRPNETWRFSAGARYDSSEFRLEEDNFVPSGIGRDSRVPVTIGVDWSPIPTLIVQGRIGAMVYQELQLRDRDRNELASTNVDPNLFVSIGLVLRF